MIKHANYTFMKKKLVLMSSLHKGEQFRTIFESL